MVSRGRSRDRALYKVTHFKSHPDVFTLTHAIIPSHTTYTNKRTYTILHNVSGAKAMYFNDDSFGFSAALFPRLARLDCSLVVVIVDVDFLLFHV